MGNFSFKEFFSTFFSSFKKNILEEKKKNKKYFCLVVIAILILFVNVALIINYNLVEAEKKKQEIEEIAKNFQEPDGNFINKIISLKIGQFSDPINIVYSWQYLAMTSGGYKQYLMSAATAKSVYVKDVEMSNWQEVLVKKIYEEGYLDDSLNGGYKNLAFNDGKFFVKVKEETGNSLIIYFGVIPG
jgi:hypothetical protein